MSIPVELDDLRRATDDYGDAYVLTVRDDQRPHIVSARPEWDGGQMVMAVGRGTAANAGARPSISLCYPPAEAGGHSLIVDGTASVDADGTLRFAPTGAVLHRPATDGSAPSATGCASDCLPVDASPNT